MAKKGSGSVSIYLESSGGGTSTAIKSYVLEMGGVKITSAMEPSHAFGDTWEEQIASGLQKTEPISLGGHWNSTTSEGPHVMFISPDSDPDQDARALIVGFSSDRFFSTDVRVTDYEVIGSLGKVTQFKSTLLPTGTAGWCSTTSGLAG